MIVQFSRSAKRRRTPGLGEPVSQNSTACALTRASSDTTPGSVDIRYRVELEVDGMPTWPSPALQVLELP